MSSGKEKMKKTLLMLGLSAEAHARLYKAITGADYDLMREARESYGGRISPDQKDLMVEV